VIMTTMEDVERRLAELERWREGEQHTLLQAVLTTQSELVGQVRTLDGRLGRVENAVVNLEREAGDLRLEMRAGFGSLTTLINQVIQHTGGDSPTD
jgi:hypothetical protein